MSNLGLKKKVWLIKEVLKAIHRGEDVEILKKKFREVLSQVNSFEIPLIEQELVTEGANVSEILKLCDLQVALFGKFLKSKALKDVPKGHPIDLFLGENEFILKKAEALRLYSKVLHDKSRNVEDTRKVLGLIRNVLSEKKEFFPVAWTLFFEGEWAAIHEIAGNIEWIFEVKEDRRSRAKPIMPYEVNGRISKEQN